MLINNDQHYSSNEEKETLLNNYFAEQSTLLEPPLDFSLPDFNNIYRIPDLMKFS